MGGLWLSSGRKNPRRAPRNVVETQLAGVCPIRVLASMMVYETRNTSESGRENKKSGTIRLEGWWAGCAPGACGLGDFSVCAFVFKIYLF